MVAEQQTDVMGVISTLEELREDPTTPKNIQIKIQEITNVLRNGHSDPLVINRIRDELDQLAVEQNMESFTRMQIYNIISIMELM